MSSNSLGGANISNWRERPYSIHGFAKVKEILPTQPVEINKNDVMQLPSAPQSFDDFSIKLEDGSALGMGEFLALTETDGFVVLKDGQVVYECYGNDNTADTPHIIMSATKSVVGLLLGILVENGTVKIDALASDYVPEIGNTCYKGVTIRQLIDMRAGVNVDDWDHKYRAAMGWDPKAPDDNELTGLYDYLANVSASSDPHGGPMKYLSHNTDLVGWILERATGKELSQLISELLWKPIGAASEAYMTVDSEANPRAAGGLCVSARDLARLGQVVLDNGQRGNQQVIPKTWIDDMRENGSHEAWQQGAWARMFGSFYESICYRSAWIVVDDKPGMLVAMGIHGQNLFVDHTNRIVIAKTSSQPDKVDIKLARLAHRAARAIQQYLCSPSNDN